MAIIYHVYTNSGRGGPVDYSTPVASTTGLTYTAGPLDPGSDTTFAVRAFDPDSGLEEGNTEARVRVVLGPDGRDISARPGSPHALALTPGPGGSFRMAWAYAPASDRVPPLSFNVYLWSGQPGGQPPVAATAAYSPGKVGYSVSLPGPYAPGTYSATVTAVNSAGEGDPPAPATAILGVPADPFDMETVSVSFI